MHGTISRWGNSLALRLPRHVAEQIHLKEGATVELEIQDGALKIIPSRKKFRLSELLEGEPKRAENSPSAEFDWGKPRGDEAW